MSFQCIECTKEQNPLEFDTVEALHKHIKSGHIWTEDKLKKLDKKPKAVETKPAVNIILKYVYEGSCHVCNNPVKTLMIGSGTLENKLVAIAYCIHCDKQLMSKTVLPMDKQPQ